MFKIKTPRIPIRLPNQYNIAKSTNPPIIPSSSEVPSKESKPAANSSPIVASLPASQPVTGGSNTANAQTASAARSVLPTNVRDFVNDKVSALLSVSYQQSVANNPAQKTTKPAVVNKNDINPIQAYEWEKIKGLLPNLPIQTKGKTSSTNVKQTTAGNPSTSVGPLNVRPFGMSLPADNGQSPSDTVGIPSEYADLAKVVASLPDGFDLTGWDDKTTREQRSAMQRSGLNGQEQMQLLNARTSIETIALVQDIQRNRLSNGLSYTGVSDISKQLFDISNARIGAKNHAMPFSENATSTSTIDEAKFIEYPETRFKKLINDLTLPQLAVFVDQVDQLGVRRLSKAGNYERLMRALLSDKDIAHSVSANDTESPIRPYIWNGSSVAKDEDVQISGYYYKNKGFYLDVDIPNRKTEKYT